MSCHQQRRHAVPSGLPCCRWNRQAARGAAWQSPSSSTISPPTRRAGQWQSSDSLWPCGTEATRPQTRSTGLLWVPLLRREHHDRERRKIHPRKKQARSGRHNMSPFELGPVIALLMQPLAIIAIHSGITSSGSRWRERASFRSPGTALEEQTLCTGAVFAFVGGGAPVVRRAALFASAMADYRSGKGAFPIWVRATASSG